MAPSLTPELQQTINCWLEDQCEDLIPHEWQVDFGNWKKQCLDRMLETQRTRDLLQRLETHCLSLDRVLDLFSAYWFVFRVRKTVPTDWENAERIDELKPIVLKELRTDSSVEVSKDVVSLVLDILKDHLKAARFLRTGSGRVEKFHEKVFLHTLRSHLKERCPKIKDRLKVMADLLKFFFPEEFPNYEGKQISDLLEGFNLQSEEL
jgi:hypothetical protein